MKPHVKTCIDFITEYAKRDTQWAVEFALRLIESKNEDKEAGGGLIWFDGCSNDDMDENCNDKETCEPCKGRIDLTYCMQKKMVKK